MKMTVNEIKKLRTTYGVRVPKETLYFFDMDSAFEDQTLGDDKGWCPRERDNPQAQLRWFGR